jgi:hypothetical protein
VAARKISEREEISRKEWLAVWKRKEERREI